MIENIKHNRMWLVTGFETLLLGCFFIAIPMFFDRNMNVLDAIVQHLDDQPSAVGLIIVGTFAIIVSLWNMHRYHARQIMIGSLQFVWTIFFVSFAYHDLFDPRHALSTIMAVSIMIRICVEAWWGDHK